ncbi:type I DNA topoisomerase [Parvularcula dongshanensis]|uniref:DNA topoisomerase 1 n=1 Tax=Parvularcula dongshanensis TaxID=1173995 RepID=A0A840I2S7_9PROT|nr:type I DNA topoisomerase [Parvularcula dongshanensis]MBB4659306.1 DNA topoisomerase-1 [Parvularcula dongshanensis]
MQVVIVESPSKAKTINKYLGKDYEVLASYGHIRDLPSKDGSVNPDDDFAMVWESDVKSRKQVSAIVDAVKRADRVILATDPDREGEAISWHLLEVLQNKKVLKDKPVDRVAFNAITKTAVQEAIANPRRVDQDLVDAYLARRALDYLVGFTLSPVLWRKLPGARSAGRVQSVALRIICEREIEIERFKAEEFWTLKAEANAGTGPFEARLVRLDGNKLEKFSLTTAEDGARAKAAVENATFRIGSVEAKPVKRNPSAPFTTSTLQQEASRKLGFSAKRTMQAAQRLYEGITIGGETTGLITYMRTDGIDMAPEAVMACRDEVRKLYGEDYVPSSPRMYKSKQKNAQEAHECIRPTSFTRHPDDLKNLESDQYRLYDLIWKRAMACQIESARLEQTTIEIESADKQVGLRATGSVVTFDGFLKVYEEGRDDTGDTEGHFADSARLPKVEEGANTDVDKATPEQHFTQPPPRYTEASLVKRLEELSIGRPSTYASIISTLQDRAYVEMDGKRFIPGDKGRIVTAFLENFFGKYVAYDFTADMEETLDEISNGDVDWRAFLARFWREFHAQVEGMSGLRITEVLDALNEALGPHIFPDRGDGSDPRECPTCHEGQLSLKMSRYGAFIGCTRYPECNYTRQLGQSEEEALEEGDRVLGVDPNTSLEVMLKKGRFGPYVQLGEPDPETKEKPKRASIPKGWDVATLDFDRAMMLLELPRDVGPHPEDGEMITAAIGRYGPYVKHNSLYANLPSVDDVFEIGLNRAVSVLEDKKNNPRGRGRAAAKPLKELGAHPETGEPVNVFEGRYGPYVKHGKTNATVPKDVKPDDVTLEQAVALIAEREAKAPAKKTKKAAKKKAPAKKKATKKAAKKAPAKKTARKAAAE